MDSEISESVNDLIGTFNKETALVCPCIISTVSMSKLQNSRKQWPAQPKLALHRQYWHRLDSADIPPGAKHSFLLLLPFEDVYIQGYAGIPFHGF